MYKIEVMKSVSGNYFWHLKSRNRRILAHSETYSRKEMCMKTVNKLAKALKCPIRLIDEEKEAIE